MRTDVWQLSRLSAGICVRFESDASDLSARWELLYPSLDRPHIAATAASGLDLYARADDGRWRWLGLTYPDRATKRAHRYRAASPSP